MPTIELLHWDQGQEKYPGCEHDAQQWLSLRLKSDNKICQCCLELKILPATFGIVFRIWGKGRVAFASSHERFLL